MLAVIEGRPVAFVEIVGSGQTDLVEGAFAETGYAAASSLVTKLSPSVRPRVTSIAATPDGGDIRLFLSTGDGRLIEVRLGLEPQMARLAALHATIEDLGQMEAALETLEKITEKVDRLTVFGGLDGVLQDTVRINLDSP